MSISETAQWRAAALLWERRASAAKAQRDLLRAIVETVLEDCLVSDDPTFDAYIRATLGEVDALLEEAGS